MKKLSLLFFILAFSTAAFAQIETPVTWSYAAKRVSATEAVVYFKASIDQGWHIYSLKDVKGPVKTTFTFSPSPTFSLVGAATEPKPITKYEKTFKTDVSYFENEVVFQQKIKVKAGAAVVVKGTFEYMTCDDSRCLPPEEISFSVNVPAKPAAK